MAEMTFFCKASFCRRAISYSWMFFILIITHPGLWPESKTLVKAKKQQQTSEGSRIFGELFGKSVKSSIPNYKLKQCLQTRNI